MGMQFDRKALASLANMSDEKLGQIIKELASEHGVDISSVRIDPESIGKLRSALSGTTDAELKKILSGVDAERLGKKKDGGDRNGK